MWNSFEWILSFWRHFHWNSGSWSGEKQLVVNGKLTEKMAKSVHSRQFYSILPIYNIGQSFRIFSSWFRYRTDPELKTAALQSRPLIQTNWRFILRTMANYFEIEPIKDRPKILIGDCIHFVAGTCVSNSSSARVRMIWGKAGPLDCDQGTKTSCKDYSLCVSPPSWN